MKKTNLILGLIILSFLTFSCSLSKTKYPFHVIHGGKWVLYDKEEELKIGKENLFISLDPNDFTFKGYTGYHHIKGRYFLSEKKISFFNIEIIPNRENEDLEKVENVFISLLKKANNSSLTSSDFKIYNNKLLLLHLKRTSN